MLITPEILAEFQTLAVRADGDKRVQARFEKKHFYQKLSSLNPLYQALAKAERERTQIAWGDVKGLVAGIPLAKQQQYSVVIKYVQKTLEGHRSHIFASLKTIGTKLSKFQQRYTNPLLNADPTVTEAERTFAAGGLCLNLSLLWLKGQFDGTPEALYPRLDRGNVIGSAEAYAVTKQAASLTQSKTDLSTAAKGLGLKVVNKKLSKGGWYDLSFDRCQDFFDQNPTLRAILVSFFQGWHAVALFREPSRDFLFFDSNAGSYRVPNGRLQAFLLEFNNNCLPNKWPATPEHPAYSEPAATAFSNVWEVSKA